LVYTFATTTVNDDADAIVIYFVGVVIINASSSYTITTHTTIHI
jgi:hypothetical protein